MISFFSGVKRKNRWGKDIHTSFFRYGQCTPLILNRLNLFDNTGCRQKKLYSQKNVNKMPEINRFA